MTLADSLRHVIAAKDSMLALAASRPVTINVPPQHISLTTSRDIVDVLVNPSIALLAALAGAALGGWLAWKGSSAAIQAEYMLNRDDAVERLRRRIDRNLIRTMTLSIAARKHDPRASFEPATISELRMIWESYDRLADYLGYLGKRLVQDHVDSFFARVREAADSVADLEARDGRLALEQARDPSAIAPGEERGRLVEERRQAIEGLSKMEFKAKRLWLDIYYLAQPPGQRGVDDAAAERALAAELSVRTSCGGEEAKH
jgi:hypothetical protein